MMRIFAVCVFLCFAGCSWGNSEKISTSDIKQAEETNRMLNDAHKQVGMPDIKNFQERKWAKKILELRDRTDLITYTYVVNFDGKTLQEKFIFVGKSIGYGLPYSVQFTNPNRLVDAEAELEIRLIQDSCRVQVMSQADPNGLFMPGGLSATWVLLLDENGEPKPVYCEPEIFVSPFPLY